MSEPLKKLIELNDPNVFYSVHDIERILDAAIDRINELEAKYEDLVTEKLDHYHRLDIGNDMTDGPEEWGKPDVQPN